MEELENKLKGFSEEERKSISRMFARLQRKLAKKNISVEIKDGKIIYTSDDGTCLRAEDIKALLPSKTPSGD